MLTILKMSPIGNKGEQPVVYFEFGFDNTIELPKLAFQIGEDISIVANNSIAVNNKTNVVYKFNDDSWVKTNDKYTSSNNSNITTNGNYSIANNSIGGFNSVNVDVEPTGLIEKEITENGEYLPVDDNATAYSKVVVDVASENIIPPIVAIYPYAAWDMEKGGSNNPIPLVLIYNNGNNNVINANTIYDTNKYSFYGAGAWNSDGQAGQYDSAKLVITSPAKRINYSYDELIIFFTPSEDFEGVYRKGTIITPGDTITPGDGYIYMIRSSSITKFHRTIDGTYISE